MTVFVLSAGLDPRVPLVAAVFPETAVPTPQARQAVDELDAHQVLGLLVTELPLDPHA